MAELRFDVLGIGNAIVDVLARADDDLLVRERLAKGSMRLIDAAEAERIYGALGPAVESSGGSAGNTVAGVASLGGRGAFIGKVADDQLGAIYRHDMRALGVTFDTPPLADAGVPTARSMILVTPDGERTMNTYLGAAQALGPEDIDEGVVAASAITFLEGYLWDPPRAKDAFRRAATLAHAAGRRVALTLSDSFCVDRYRAEFLDLIRSRTVDILLANVGELRSLYETAHLPTALAALQADAPLAAVTSGEDGSYVVTPGRIDHVAVDPVETVVDATGAGDLYAAGFLLGLARGIPLTDAARLGSLAAAEVISHMGARPATPLKQLAAEAGFEMGKW
ncbi:MAG: adenosine kinase [Bauldia sp.]|nr:adenosine kinase [Bauldia sp.]